MISACDRRLRWAATPMLVALGVLTADFDSVAASGSRAQRSAGVTRVRVGPPPGHTPMARQNSRRDGRALARLPRQPKLEVRARVQGGIVGAPVADAKGNLVLSSAGSHVVELGLDGKARWKATTGSTPPATGPVLTSDGTRVVITTDARVLGFDPHGRSRFAVQLPGKGTVSVAPLALSDGGVLIVRGKEILHVGRRGTLLARTRVYAAPQQLLASGQPLFITGTGSVYRWSPHRGPRKLGSFGGRVAGGAALLDPNRLIAVVDFNRLVVLDLSTGSRDLRVRLPGLSLAPHVTVAAGGGSLVVTRDGLLLEHDKLGKERRRAALEPISSLTTGRGSRGSSPATAAGGIVHSVRGPDHAPPIVDKSGTVAFVRPGLDVGVLLQNGSTHRAEGAFCADPTAVVSAGRDRLALSCASGLLFVMSGKAAHSPP